MLVEHSQENTWQRGWWFVYINKKPWLLQNSLKTEKDKSSIFYKLFLSHETIDKSNGQTPINPFAGGLPILNGITASESEIEDILDCIDTNKSTCPDRVSPRKLKGSW